MLLDRSLDQAVLDNLSTAVVVLDDECRVIGLNLAAEALFDTSANNVRGSSVAQLLPAGRLHERALRRVLHSSQTLTEREMRLSLPGERQVTVDCSVTPVGDEGDFLLVELAHIDHHRRIAHEEWLVAQNHSVRALIRGLAHEIRNPLGGLRGAAQLLGRELGDASLTEYTDVIIREADRLQHLLERMLGPRTVPRFTMVNVHEIVERVRTLMCAEIPDGVQVCRDYDPSIPEIRADPDLLIQATLNVARNAVQAVRGEGRIVLRTRVHQQSTIGSHKHRLVIAIDIVDTGPGVPPALREHIFYPMISGHAEGTGLGLPIAQSLVNQHGGVVEFYREKGETTFRILLPEKGPGLFCRISTDSLSSHDRK